LPGLNEFVGKAKAAICLHQKSIFKAHPQGIVSGENIRKVQTLFDALTNASLVGHVDG
jgi:hypothetical protein